MLGFSLLGVGYIFNNIYPTSMHTTKMIRDFVNLCYLSDYPILLLAISASRFEVAQFVVWDNLADYYLIQTKRILY